MNSFKALCSEYDGLSSKKNMEIKTDKKIGTYENMVEGSLFKSVEFILTKDDFFDHKYKIVFGEILNFKLEDYYSN